MNIRYRNLLPHEATAAVLQSVWTKADEEGTHKGDLRIAFSINIHP